MEGAIREYREKDGKVSLRFLARAWDVPRSTLKLRVDRKIEGSSHMWCPIVTCDVGYPCPNFGLLNPLYCRLRPDVRDRQTSDRLQTSDKSIA